MSETNAPDLREEMFAAFDWYADLVEGTPDSALVDPTPCGDFDVRRLMTHVWTVGEKVIAFAREGRDPYAGRRDDPEQLEELTEQKAGQVVDGRTPIQRAMAVREQTIAARRAWTDEVLDRDIALGWGPALPGRVVAGIYLMEVLAHGWDLATATGQDVEAPAAVARAGLAAAQQTLPRKRDETILSVFGEVVPSRPDAGPTTQLANWTGRRDA